MKAIAAFNLLVVLCMTALPASAGVVITQTMNAPDGRGSTRTTTETIQIEGGRMITQQDTGGTIIDLDQRTMVMLDATSKSAMEFKLDQAGQGAQMVQAMAAAWSMQFKKTGTRRTIAGHGCDDYKSSGLLMGGDYSGLTCFANGAPGADEYSRFYKRMLGEFKIASAGGSLPNGIAMANESTMTMKMPALPPEMLKQMPPEAARQMAEAAKPQRISTQVSAIKIESIPASRFAIPAGYSKVQAP